MKTEVEWKDYLQEQYIKTFDSYKELGNRLIEFRNSCENISGGTTFHSKVKQWIGIDSSSCSQLIKISQDEKLFFNKKKLPNSRISLYHISTLSEDDFNNGIESGLINPNMTQKNILDYKQKLKTLEQNQKAKEKFERDKPKRERLQKIESNKRILKDLIIELYTKKPISIIDAKTISDLINQVIDKNLDEIKNKIIQFHKQAKEYKSKIQNQKKKSINQWNKEKEFKRDIESINQILQELLSKKTLSEKDKTILYNISQEINETNYHELINKMYNRYDQMKNLKPNDQEQLMIWINKVFNDIDIDTNQSDYEIKKQKIGIMLGRLLDEELIKVTIKALSHKLHPDKGGNKEKFQELMKIKEQFKKIQELI